MRNLGLSLLVIIIIIFGSYIFYRLNYKDGEAWPKHEHKPFIATLPDSLWVVKGTLREGARGGVPYAIIQKNDCKVIRIYHTK